MGTGSRVDTFVVETVDNGYVLRYTDGILSQFHHAIYFKTTEGVADKIDIILHQREKSRQPK